MRRADYEGTCNTLKPSLTGSFSADEAVFATKTLLAPGSCRGLSTTPVRETFTGTGAVRSKAAGSTLSVKMRAETRLSYDGKHSPELIRMSADGNLSATKLEVTIANAGNF